MAAPAFGEGVRWEALSSRITGNTEVDSHKIASGSLATMKVNVKRKNASAEARL